MKHVENKRQCAISRLLWLSASNLLLSWSPMEKNRLIKIGKRRWLINNSSPRWVTQIFQCDTILFLFSLRHKLLSNQFSRQRRYFKGVRFQLLNWFNYHNLLRHENFDRKENHRQSKSFLLKFGTSNFPPFIALNLKRSSFEEFIGVFPRRPEPILPHSTVTVPSFALLHTNSWTFISNLPANFTRKWLITSNSV